MNAIVIGKVSVDPERQVPQIIKKRFADSDGELVENCAQLVILLAGNIKGDSVALLRGARSVDLSLSLKTL